jgi:hypothetical protein
VPIYVNFLRVASTADAADRIERACREQLDGTLKQWFSEVVSTLRPRLKAAPGGVGVEISPNTQTPALLTSFRRTHSCTQYARPSTSPGP